MKLTYFQLEQHLKNQLASVYIISGDELLLKQDAINIIRKAAKLSGFGERIRITPEAGFDWEELYSMLYSTSLLAEKRLIELDFRDVSPNKTAAKILESYGEKVVSDNILLIDIGKIDDKVSKSAWYKSLDKAGMVVAIWPIPREQLPQWIINRAKKYKLQINMDAANLLADYVEGNLVAAAQTIEKIYLFKHEGMIDATLIQTIITDESRFTVFDFIESLISGDKTKSFHILETLKQDGTEPILILWAITRELRMLIDMSNQLKQGMTYETIFQKHRIFAKRQNTVRKFLNHSSAENCHHHLSHAAEIDRMIKGASPGNAWEALQFFCLRI